MNQHSHSIGAGDFKATCLKLLDEVARSRQPVIITKHGRPRGQACTHASGRRLVRRLGRQRLREDDIVSPLDESWDALR